MSKHFELSTKERNPYKEGFGETSPTPLSEGGHFSLKNGGDGSLDTCLRIIATKNVIYTPATDINRHKKQANLEALKYFLNTKIHEIKMQLVNDCICKHYNIKYDGQNFDIKNIPLDIMNMVNIRLTSYLNQCLLGYAERHFLNYINESKKKHSYIHVYRDDQHALKKLENRYHKSYCRKVKKRMNYLVYKFGNENAVLLTLTINPKNYQNDKLRMWKNVKKDFHIFMENLRIYLKRHGSTMPKYIHAIESQKNGNPHIHVVFFQAKRICDWRKISKFWGKGFVFINRTSKGKKVRYPVHYVTKYITKTFADTNPENVLTQSMVWLFNMRSFDRSKGLMIPLNPKSTGEWNIGGIAIIPAMESQLNEMIAIQDVIQSLYGGFKIPPPQNLIKTT